MAQEQRKFNAPAQPVKDLPVHIIEQIIDNQKQQIILQGQELKIREKELDINGKIAEKQLGYQAEYLKNRPSEARKSMQLVIFSIIGTLVIFLLFFGYCISTGNSEFALKMFGYMMYVVTTCAGYYAGKSKANKKQQDVNNNIEDATIVD